MQDDLAGLVEPFGWWVERTDMNGDPESFYTDMRSQIHYGTVTPLYSATTTLEALTRENAELREKADKFMWQVRDTCTRAEKAEAERDAALAEVDRAGLQVATANNQRDAANSRTATHRIALADREARLGEAFRDGWDECEKLYMPGAHPFYAYADVDSALIAFLAKQEPSQ